MSGNLQQQRAAVEQLRREANIKRISVSQAVEDIKVSQLAAGGGHNPPLTLKPVLVRFAGVIGSGLGLA